jgi:serine/threonine protein kinase
MGPKALLPLVLEACDVGVLMFLLPAKIGPFTLMRRLRSTGVSETFVGMLDEPAGRQVRVHRLVPALAASAAMMPSIRARIQDLSSVSHPTIARVHELVDAGDDTFVITAWTESISLQDILEHCRETGQHLPRPVFLQIASQLCSALEVLHSHPATFSGREHVLHQGLTPRAIRITTDNQVRLADFGLIRSPTMLPLGGATSPVMPRMEYLAPEQTYPDRPLGPESDIFALGALFYEALTLTPLFKAESNLQTIHAIRRAEVSAQLLRAKDEMPGIDKVLYRALSLNGRHRFQRAFVMREDIRGLMAGFSFTEIDAEMTAFLAPMRDAGARDPGTPVPADAHTDETQALRRPTLSPMQPFVVDPEEDDAPTDVQFALEEDREHADAASSSPGLPISLAPPAPPRIDDLALDEAFGETPISDDDLLLSSPDAYFAAISANDSADPLAPRRSANVTLTPPEPDLLLDDNLLDGDGMLGDDLLGTMDDEVDLDGGLLEDQPEPVAVTVDVELQPEPDVEDIEIELGPAVTDVELGLDFEPVMGLSLVAARTESDDTIAVVSVEIDDDSDEAPLPDPLDEPTGVVHRPVQIEPVRTGIEEAISPIAFIGGNSQPMLERSSAPSPADSTLPPPPEDPSETGWVRRPVEEVTQWDPVAREVSNTVAQEVSNTKPPNLPPAVDPQTADWEEDDASPLWIGFGAGLLVALMFFTCIGGGFVFWQFGGSGTPSGTELAVAQPSLAPALAPVEAEPPVVVEDPVPAETTAPAVAPAPVIVATRPAPAVRTTPTPAPRPAPVARPAPPPAPPPPPVARPAPRPAPVARPAPRPAPVARPAPRPAPIARPAPRPAPIARPAPRPAPVVPSPAPVSAPAAIVAVRRPAPQGELASYMAPALRGALTDDERMTLTMVERTNPAFEEARGILYEDAKARDDVFDREQHLDAILSIPRNEYNPQYLVEQAELYLRQGNFETALARAQTAERNWARLPSDILFSRKAMIYETEALALQGLFYQASDPDMLYKSIRAWERYKTHVQSADRSDLASRADTQLIRLTDMQQRIE